MAGARPGAAGLHRLQEAERTRSSGSRRAPKRKSSVPIGELFSDPRWRRNSIVGLLLAFAGVVGLWGIGFFSYDLFRPVLERTFTAQGLAGTALAGKVTTWIGVTSLLQNIGCFFGVYAFTYLTHYTGRKKAFAVAFLAAMGMTSYTFWNLKQISDIFWMIPLMGFAQLSLFGGYAIYLAGVIPHAAAQHRHQLLLQRGPFRRGGWPVHPRLPDQGRLRRLCRTHALRRRDDEPCVPGWLGRPAIRPRNQGETAP